MRIYSENFRESLQNVRQLNSIISYQSKDSFYLLSTENNNNLLTELEDFLITQKGTVEISKEKLLSINPLFNTHLLKTTCKMIEIETVNDIPIKTKINAKIGVKVGEEYEYMDYGNYYVQNSIYQADKNSYLIIAYDKMIESMILYDDKPLNISYPISIKELLIAICNKFGWKYNFTYFINQDKLIKEDLYSGQNMTYRNILDEISQVVAGNLLFNLDEELVIKYINKDTNSTLLPFTIGADKVINVCEDNDDYIITGSDLKNTNVSFGEKYGPINALVITTSGDVVINNRVNQESIDEDGKTEFQIDDNHILNAYPENYIDNIFSQLKGIEYYLYDVETIGMLVLEPLDRFVMSHNNISYPTILLNDDIRITTGLVENCYAEKPEISVDEYVVNDDIQKLNRKISLKVSKDNLISEINLSPEVIELKGNRLVVDSTNFKLDKEGNALFSGNINTSKDSIVGDNIYIGQNQNESNIDQKYLYFSNGTYFKRTIVGSSENISLYTPSFTIRNGNYNCHFNDVNMGVQYPKIMLDANDYLRLLTADDGTWLDLGNSSITTNRTITNVSDKRLKQEIKDVDISWIDELNIKEFEYKNTPNKKQIGLIAQDYLEKGYSKYFLEKIKIPNEEQEYYGISYGNITNALIKYCQNLNNKVNDLQSQVDELKEMIKNG